MRLMTDRKTYDKSAVAPVAPGEVSLLPPEADVPKAKVLEVIDLTAQAVSMDEPVGDAYDRSLHDVIEDFRTPEPEAVADSFSIRRAALNHGLPYFTTAAAASAAAGAIHALEIESIGVRPLQEIHRMGDSPTGKS